MEHTVQSRVVRVPRRCKGAALLAATGSLLCLIAAAGYGADSPSCSANPESRQFDFWLGDWAITYPGAPGGSASTVSLMLDQCMLVETWDGGRGHSGKNIFAYSAEDKHWHGMFADNQGRVHVFEGKVASGAAEFYGPSLGANGEAVRNRIRVVRIGGDKVEQRWEKSADNGATWTTVFRGEYQRKNP